MLEFARRENEVFLNINNLKYPELNRSELIRIMLTAGNKPVTAPKVTEDEHGMTLSCPAGTVRFEAASQDKLIITGNSEVRFEFRNLRQFDNACALGGGTLEVAFVVLGKLLFKPISGALYHNALWIPAKAQADDFDAVLLPDASTGHFECELLEYFSNPDIELLQTR
jgi:hypothetical protein